MGIGAEKEIRIPEASDHVTYLRAGAGHSSVKRQMGNFLHELIITYNASACLEGKTRELVKHMTGP